MHYCYATQGPMKLASALMASTGSTSGDCLAQSAPGRQTMLNPEPGFFILGMKSYGRSSAFLLRLGHEQVQLVLELLLPKMEAKEQPASTEQKLEQAPPQPPVAAAPNLKSKPEPRPESQFTPETESATKETPLFDGARIENTVSLPEGDPSLSTA